MIFIEFIILSIYFLWSTDGVLKFTEINSIVDVLTTYTGTNALLLHFSIYACVNVLMIFPMILAMNSETMIRLTSKKILKQFIIMSIKNSLVFLLSLYSMNSFFIINGLGLEYYLESKVMIPIIISMIVYSIIYLIIEFIFFITYILTKRIVLSLLSTISISFISTFLFKNIYGYLMIFEKIYIEDGLSIFQIIQIGVVLMTLLYININLCQYLLQTGDFIYEDEL